MPGGFVLPLLFFVSGAASLIFEIVWLYRCSLVFGSTVRAASIALASFMGGLAIGNGLAGACSSRIRRPLRAYATAEFVVALAGLAVTNLLSMPSRLIVPLAPYRLDTLWVDDLLRLVMTMAALLVPATAMGTTLPLIVGELCRHTSRFGRVLGRLYGWNTLGAVIG